MKKQNRKFIFYALLSVALFYAGCRRFEGGLAYFAPQLSGYQGGRVVNAKPINDFEIPIKTENLPYLEFIAVGCAGSGNRGQKILAKNMAELAAKEKISFILYLGDNFYPYGVKSVKDKQWQTKFENMFDQESLQIPFYAILGNHDYVWNEQAQVEYTESSKRWRMPMRYYQFTQTLPDSTQIDFFAVDTELLVQGKREEQIKWLEKTLGNSTAQWKIVFGHRPLYTGDWRYRHKTENIRKILEPLLIKHKADFYISAHSHNIEVLKPIEGIHYIVSGAGSRPRNIEWGDQTLFASASIGYAYIRISRPQVDVLLNGDETEAFTLSKIQPQLTFRFLSERCRHN